MLYGGRAGREEPKTLSGQSFLLARGDMWKGPLWSEYLWNSTTTFSLSFSRYMCPEDGSSLMNLCKMQKDEMLRGTDIFRLEESEIKGCWKQEWGKYQTVLCQAVNVKHICKLPWPSLWELKCDVSYKSQINPYTTHMQIRPKETEKFENLIDNGIIGEKASKAHGLSLIGFSPWYKYTTLSRRF